MPSSRSVWAIWQPFSTWVRKFLRHSRSSRAGPPPVGGQTGATTEPIVRFRLSALSASRFRSSYRHRSKCAGRTETGRIHRTLAVDRSIGGQIEHRIEIDKRFSSREPFPTTPGQAALWSVLGVVVDFHGGAFSESQRSGDTTPEIRTSRTARPANATVPKGGFRRQRTDRENRAE